MYWEDGLPVFSGSEPPAVPHFAYVFERFPTFTQTFCVREVLELERQGMRPMIFSIRDTRAETPRHFPDELYNRVHFLPPEKELIDFIKAEKDANRLPQEIVLSLRQWGDRPDKLRVYEAAYIGQQMRRAGLRHAHSHFAGVGARACWWLKHAHDFTYSFTGHANDIFCEEGDLDVTLERLIHDASLVVTVSDFTAGELRAQFPRATRRIVRIYNGLEPDLYRVERRQEDPPLIFSVGRLIEKKGFDDLIAACALLRRDGVRFQCCIAGEGPLEEALRADIARHQLEDSVRLLGAVPQQEIIRTLGRTSVFALPCVTERGGGKDNLPTVLMEAMSAEVPCVSTRLAGVPEMVEHGVTGLLVEERRPDLVAAALAELLADPERGREMGRLGRLRALRLFAREKTSLQLIRQLTRRGLVRWDPGLLRRHPVLAADYPRQMMRRLLRVARLRPLRHRTAPDFLQPAAGTLA